jgi:hypothetical protein
MNKLFATVAMLLVTCPALAGGVPRVAARPLPLLVHNGSLMTQVFDPTSGHLLIQYKDPRPGLWGVGVIPGTVLIDAQLRGPTIAGTAFVFSGICPPTPYRVAGGVSPAGVVVLRGGAPLLDPYSCNVLTLVPSQNSELVFTPY